MQGDLSPEQRADTRDAPLPPTRTRYSVPAIQGGAGTSFMPPFRVPRTGAAESGNTGEGEAEIPPDLVEERPDRGQSDQAMPPEYTWEERDPTADAVTDVDEALLVDDVEPWTLETDGPIHDENATARDDVWTLGERVIDPEALSPESETIEAPDTEPVVHAPLSASEESEPWMLDEERKESEPWMLDDERAETAGSGIIDEIGSNEPDAGGAVLSAIDAGESAKDSVDAEAWRLEAGNAEPAIVEATSEPEPANVTEEEISASSSPDGGQEEPWSIVTGPGTDVETPDQEIPAPSVPAADVSPWEAFDKALQASATWEPPPEVPDAPVVYGGEREARADEAADRLEALARRLREEGPAALDHAAGTGDRLESALAAFLAGFMAASGD